MTKTREEIESLKKSWLHDPCWEIEDTEGFEEHREELLAFHKEKDQEWEAKKLEREEKRSIAFAKWTGIRNFDLAQVISTPDEIERELSSIDNNIGEASTNYELAQLVIAREQVRATMLLMTQVKRIADLLRKKMDREEDESDTNFMTRLYKVD